MSWAKGDKGHRFLGLLGQGKASVQFGGEWRGGPGIMLSEISQRKTNAV